jgi:hypothetical protein
LKKSETGVRPFCFFVPMAWKNNTTAYYKVFSAPLLFAAGVLSFLVLVPAVEAASMTPSAVIELANRARVAAGLPALAENEQLSAAAREKAKDMIKNDYFAHTSPQGHDPWYFIRQSGYAYKAAGENLAINYEDPKEQQGAWMKSETHRANILNTKYTETGVAVVEGKIDGETSLVTVQMFGMPAVAIVDRAAPVVPVVLQEAKVPAIKGVETGKSETVPVAIEQQPAVSEAPKHAPAVLPVTAGGAQSAWFEEVWYVAVALLIVAVFMAPMALVTKSISALYSQFREEQLLHAAYQAEVMSLTLSGHIRTPEIQHSG